MHAPQLCAEDVFHSREVTLQFDLRPYFRYRHNREDECRPTLRNVIMYVPKPNKNSLDHLDCFDDPYRYRTVDYPVRQEDGTRQIVCRAD